MRNFRVTDFLHTRQSWEAMGVFKGKLPSTMIIDQHGNEAYPYMTMNGLLIDPTSPELIARMRQLRLFSPSAMLPTLEQIKAMYGEYFDDENPTFRNRGPFPILDKIQSLRIRLQNLLFQELSEIDAEVKTTCMTVVRSHKEAVAMKDSLELSIAMLELADNKVSKTFDHDTANRIIDSYRAGLRKAEFENVTVKNELATMLQTYKMSRDQGEILDLEILLSDIMGAFTPVEEVHEPTLQAAMLATTTRVEHQDQRGPSGAGGAPSSRPSQPYKRRYDDDKPSAAQDPKVIDKILKTLYDLMKHMIS